VGEFVEFYKKVGANADTIVGLYISSKLSGTVASATTAREQLPDMDIRVFDSYSAAMGLGFMVLAAAQAAAAGKSADEVIAVVEAMREKMHILFAVDTLEFLHRGGRIGGAKRLVGTVLNIKPLLHLNEGQVDELMKVRTKRRALATMMDEAEERLGGARMGGAAVIDVNSGEEADRVAEMVKARFDLPVVYRAPVSPVIGAHAGPGTVGLAFYVE